MITVDTNLIAYFFIRSEHTALAEAVWQKESRWNAPRLWRSEFRNVLNLYIRRNALDLDGAVEKMSEAENIIGEREFDVDSRRVLELAKWSGCTSYDCEFVYVAERLDVPLVTSDKKLLAAFPDRAVSMADFTA